MTNYAKHAVASIVNGKHYGRFKIVGARFSEALGEFIYTATPIDENGHAVGVDTQVVESCLEDQA